MGSVHHENMLVAIGKMLAEREALWEGAENSKQCGQRCKARNRGRWYISYLAFDVNPTKCSNLGIFESGISFSCQ